MKIIYTGLKYNYYDPRKGLSFEHVNFYLSLKSLPDTEIIYHPFDRILGVGKEQFNKEILETVKREKPDLLFAFMFTDEFDKKTLKELKKHTKTIAWFADDSWRFYNYSRHWAPYFSWAVTTYSWLRELYRNIGQDNIIRSQWACNHKIFKPVKTGSKDIDVSFIGQKNKSRTKIINSLKEAGIKIYVRGLGWPEGRVGHDKMLEIFSRSKINLNLNTPIPLWAPKSLGRLLLKRHRNHFVPNLHIINNIKTWKSMKIPQVKARPFELAGCRAFTISGHGDDIEKFYEEDKEMIFFRSARELIKKIKHYLSLEKERQSIAEAAYIRTLREHTYEKRFRKLFHKIF